VYREFEAEGNFIAYTNLPHLDITMVDIRAAKAAKALLTNKNQAFQYLARLESKVSRTTA
jgi:hypothetical protein